MKLDLQLHFETFCHMHEQAPHVEAAVANDVPVHHAAAFMAFLQAKPFGKEVIHRKIGTDGYTKSEKVQAFTYDRYLIVVRTIGDTSRVFKFEAPNGLLLSHAETIALEHYKMSTLHLI
ncbi:hypothetical protein [Pseudomonas alabamensis]|uniref:hypothetical protein n=1 Tax=Pseudomonas alabamensis TaxID=3064349 RepID=UPI0011AA7412